MAQVDGGQLVPSRLRVGSHIVTVYTGVKDSKPIAVVQGMRPVFHGSGLRYTLVPDPTTTTIEVCEK